MLGQLSRKTPRTEVTKKTKKLLRCVFFGSFVSFQHTIQSCYKTPVTENSNSGSNRAVTRISLKDDPPKNLNILDNLPYQIFKILTLTELICISQTR